MPSALGQVPPDTDGVDVGKVSAGSVAHIVEAYTSDVPELAGRGLGLVYAVFICLGNSSTNLSVSDSGDAEGAIGR